MGALHAAGCDFGGFSIANIEFERVPRMSTTVFGTGTPSRQRSRRTSSDPDLKPASRLSRHRHSLRPEQPALQQQPRPTDPLPDEPGGYTGFKGLFGNINVQPVISPAGPVKDLDGNVITNTFGYPGFPNTFSPLATQSLGYAATMLEAGVQVVYVYIADAHDNRFGGTFGPGEAGYVAQLKQYDTAFGKFFARLAADGITTDNTLFLVTPDENDHFVGGTPTPANCDGINVPCSYATGQKGEINADLNRLLLTQRANTTTFSVHSDDAPTIYVTGNPAPTDPVTRTMAHDLDALVAVNPVTGATDKLSKLIADQAAMKLIHMVTASAARTPTMTMFGDDNYFFQTAAGGACVNASDCIFVGPNFAWNHGDFQKDITRSWFGMVGPGVHNLGRSDAIFSDHADVRPTLMALVGLSDDYVHDGRVLSEWFAARPCPRVSAVIARTSSSWHASSNSSTRRSVRWAGPAWSGPTDRSPRPIGLMPAICAGSPTSRRSAIAGGQHQAGAESRELRSSDRGRIRGRPSWRPRPRSDQSRAKTSPNTVTMTGGTTDKHKGSPHTRVRRRSQKRRRTFSLFKLCRGGSTRCAQTKPRRCEDLRRPVRHVQAAARQTHAPNDELAAGCCDSEIGERQQRLRPARSIGYFCAAAGCNATVSFFLAFAGPLLAWCNGRAAVCCPLRPSLGWTKVGRPLHRQTWLHQRRCLVDLRRRSGAARRLFCLGLYRRRGCDCILAPGIGWRRLRVRRLIVRRCRNADRDRTALSFDRLAAFPREDDVSVRRQADRCTRARRLMLGLRRTRLSELEPRKASILRTSGGERGRGHHQDQIC